MKGVTEMKKKVLFVIPSLRSGGAEKSLISVLSLFDYEKYEVDLILFRRDGLFFEKIPNKINYLYDTSEYEIFDGNGKEAIQYFVKKLNISAALDRIKYIKVFSENNEDVRDEKLWKYLKKRLPKIKKKYDCAIGYLEGNANNCVIELINADKKICYIHNDIAKLSHSHEMYKTVFEKADKVVTVSDICLDSLNKEFPEFSEKFCVIENISSRTLIKADCTEEKVYPQTDAESVILTVGRCSPQKNIELAVDACKELVNRGRRIKWYHIGKGELEETIKKYVVESGVENSFIMLGERSNPYPYMEQCDIYVQPSRFEGKSIAIDEVKCLNKPIVVTDFPTVFDQLEDGVNALICKMNKDDMADKIEMLFDDKALKEKLINNLTNEETGNEKELEKLYYLIEN